MNRSVRLAISVVVILLVTNAINYTYLITNAEGFGAAVSLLLPVTALVTAMAFMRQEGDLRVIRVTEVEVLLAMAVLELPVFAGDFWIHNSVPSLTDMGLKQILAAGTVTLFVPLVLYLDERQLKRTMQAAMIIYVLSILYDLVANAATHLITGERPGGFVINANDGASVTAALLLVSLPWKERSAAGYVLILIAFAGIIATLSRSGLILWFLVSAGYAWMCLARGSGVARGMTLAGVLVVLGGVAAFIQNPVAVAESLGLPVQAARLASIAELAQGETGSLNDSGRETLLREWSALAQERPFFGQGTGFSMSEFGPSLGGWHLGPHNMYVAREIDSGLLGLLTFLGFLLFLGVMFAIRRNGVGIAYTGLFAIASLFSQNTADQRAQLVLFGILAADSIRNLHISAPERSITVSSPTLA